MRTPQRDLPDRARTRLEGLRAGVSRLPIHGAPPALDRLLLVAGGVGLGTGLVLILLGWYGAARTPHLFEQIPYLISGGLLGLALVVAGGFVYFGSWLARMTAQSRDQARAASASIERLAELLSANGEPARLRLLTTSAPAELWATASGTLFHRAGCTAVAGRAGLRRVEAGEQGLRPCRLCDPLGAG